MGRLAIELTEQQTILLDVTANDWSCEWHAACSFGAIAILDACQESLSCLSFNA